MLDIRDLTTGESKGSGLYEELMRTSDAHIKQEFEAGRLQGESYAQVYLAAMQANLQAAIQYLLSYETTNKNLEILEEQIKQNQKQNELLELQKEQLRIANETAQYNLDHILPEQHTQAEKQTVIMTEQALQAVTQGEILDQQLVTAGKQELLLDEQILAAEAQTTDPTAGLLKAQFDKIQQEIAIGREKVDTERSQTKETTSDGSTIAGLVGKEKILKGKQADGFDRQAEIQVAKLYADTFGILFSTDQEYVTPQHFGLGSDESFAVMEKINAGIGVTRLPTTDNPLEADKG